MYITTLYATVRLDAMLENIITKKGSKSVYLLIYKCGLLQHQISHKHIVESTHILQLPSVSDTATTRKGESEESLGGAGAF